MKFLLKTTFSALSFASVLTSAQGATHFLDRGDADLIATWETWTFGDTSFTPPITPPPALGDSGSQGPAQAVISRPITLTSSNLQTTIIDEYTFPGGFNGNPDTYYLHTGGATWDLSVELGSPTDFIRLSYSLLGFGGSPAANFGATPAGPGLTEIASGSYQAGAGTVFFHDLALDSPSSQVDLSFGDVAFPGFPGSFRSIDAVQFESFTGTAPLSVPEPSSSLTFGMMAFCLLLRRRVTGRPC